MTTHIAEPSPRIEIPLIVTRARVVGFLLLLPIPLDLFGSLYVPSKLIVPGDAATTARNIMASEFLFRLGIVSTLLLLLVDVAVVLVYYQFLKPVNKNLALLMVILNLLGVPIAMLNELNQFAILLLLHSADSPSIFTPDQVHALLALLLNLHTTGSTIGGLFWGLWLVPYGLLVIKSGFFPKLIGVLIGVLLIIECFGFLIQSFGGFLVPDLAATLALLPGMTAWAELFVPLWLAIKGVNVEQWEKRARASA
ncbi:MAG TPA: DUF4386 domain-containing protein [Ktedonobacterales bacterium]|nr:DUF4386 domain-containing protein [Ktedonobacterales bacterium]